MKFRKYKPADHEKCMEVFESNCPPFFDESERQLFKNWLSGLDDGRIILSNIDQSLYYVGESNGEIVCCGGIYSLKDKKEVRLSWGMVLKEHHNKGYGKAFFKYRLEEFKKHFPNYNLKLDTSQLTVGFYERMKFKVTKIEKNGYGEGLDRYDMDYQNANIGDKQS